MVRKKRDVAASPDSAGAPPPTAAAAAALPTTTARKRRRAADAATDDDDGTKRARGGGGGAASNVAGAPRARLALALPGSSVDNAQSPAAAAALAATLARAAAVFCVDEVVVFDDRPGGGDGAVGAGAALTARVLQYLETPQYLRRALIPMHPDLRAAGALPPLDAPHHARADEWTVWREGIVLASERGAGSVVNVGLDAPAVVPAPALRPGARVTLRMGSARVAAPPLPAGPLADAARVAGAAPPIAAALAAPREPVDVAGLYWGYTVRLAPSLAAVVADAPAAYDWTVATSERGAPVGALLARAAARRAATGGGPTRPPFRSALVVVGGPAGLEAADARAPSAYDAWVNTCPGQGSRTIRTEEAVLISLAALAPALERGVGGGFGG